MHYNRQLSELDAREIEDLLTQMRKTERFSHAQGAILRLIILKLKRSGRFFMKAETIAERCHCHINTVYNAFRRLKNSQFFDVKIRKCPSTGYQISNEVFLAIRPQNLISTHHIKTKLKKILTIKDLWRHIQQKTPFGRQLIDQFMAAARSIRGADHELDFVFDHWLLYWLERNPDLPKNLYQWEKLFKGWILNRANFATY